jgi:hypothetical protein
MDIVVHILKKRDNESRIIKTIMLYFFIKLEDFSLLVLILFPYFILYGIWTIASEAKDIDSIAQLLQALASVSECNEPAQIGVCQEGFTINQTCEGVQFHSPNRIHLNSKSGALSSSCCTR